MRKLISAFNSLPAIRVIRLVFVMLATGVALLWRGAVKTNPEVNHTVFGLIFGTSIILLVASYIMKKT